MREATSGRVPPEHLMRRVGGMSDPAVFSSIGRAIATDVVRLTRPTGRAAVLDFGTGCGRVLRELRGKLPDVRLTGLDVDREAIGWAGRELSDVADFVVGPHVPPLEFDDDSFDVVFAISVFTHLHPDRADAWAEELRRVVRPGGLLLLTVYGDAASRILDEDSRERIRRQGVLFVEDGGTEGLPEWYQSCFHATEYVTGRWSHHGDSEQVLPAAVIGSLDAVVIRKAEQ